MATEEKPAAPADANGQETAGPDLWTPDRAIIEAVSSAKRASNNLNNGCREWGLAHADMAKVWIAVADGLYRMAPKPAERTIPRGR